MYVCRREANGVLLMGGIGTNTGFGGVSPAKILMQLVQKPR